MAGGSKSPASSLEDGKAYVNAVKVALEEAEPCKISRDGYGYFQCTHAGPLERSPESVVLV
ncbi:unnamed protein product [Arabidopsis thaliana]|uniref:(thale cress) hypothetical protein n=1 Tax=Arabidopsis thaliana TaxID=3702 RepID=A0A7G2E1M1_ARATH|nr:unnamed protein product [Arabidopsis thaliana]